MSSPVRLLLNDLRAGKDREGNTTLLKIKDSAISSKKRNTENSMQSLFSLNIDLIRLYLL